MPALIAKFLSSFRIENNNLTTKQVQAELGHASADITLNVYTGISEEEKARTGSNPVFRLYAPIAQLDRVSDYESEG